MRAHDQGFVAASPEVVYRALAETEAYGSWWTDSAAGGSDRAVRLRLEPRRVAEATAERHREGIGLFLRLGAPYDGTLEWYLEPFDDGTIVNVLLDADLGGGGTAVRRVRRMRSAIRRGLVGLKGRLEWPE
jgi:uncharacterized protein YndB with AHSA1/START domain